MTEEKHFFRKTFSFAILGRIKGFFILFMALFINMGTVQLQAQNKLSLKLQNVSLEQAVDFIEEKTDYRFLFNKSLVDETKKVSVDASNQSIEVVLKQLLNGTGIGYIITGHQIVLQKASRVTQNADQYGDGGPRKVTGKIVDVSGEPVIGATVMVKGDTSKGTVTDYDGNFLLPGVPNDATISISYVGYQSVELPAGSPQLVNLVLKEDSELLEEVVVVGYGVQKKVNLTGAVSSISGKELNNRPVVSAAMALQGADPSLNIGLSTGSPASGYNINIRGVMSVNGGSPLILVDGVETSLTQINPNDIESVSVLKDASASAIYGAKASSGVVLVTTKRGKKSEKASISYSGRFGISQNTTSNDYITSGYDHINIVNKFYRVNRGNNMFNYSEEDLKLLKDRGNDKTEHPDRPWTLVGDDNKYYYYGNFDWYNYFYRESRPQHEHNVSINGGSDKINYYVSGRFLQQEGIFKIYPDQYKNYSFRTRLDAELTSWLKYSNNINYNVNNYTYAGYRNEQQTIHSLQSNVNSVFVPINPDGSIVQYTNQMSANSPLGAGHAGFLTANKSRNARGNRQLTISNQLDLSLSKYFVLTASHGYRYYNRLNKYRNLPFEYSREKDVFREFTSGTIYDEYREVKYDSYLNNFNIYGTFTTVIDRSHNLSVVAGTQYETFRGTENEMIQRDLLSAELSSFSVATGEAKIDQNISTYATLGYFGRFNYDYKGKYLFEASGRYDGSSRFKSGKDRWGFFPSVSAGWRISEEEFWKPIDNIWSNAKIRFSFGSLGNQQVSNYSYIDQISTNKAMNYTFDGNKRAEYASVSDPISSRLTWETVYTYNVGADLGFLKNRLNVTADYFIRDTKNMLIPGLTLPAVYGAKTPKENAADMRTRGWELLVSWRDQFNVLGKPFSYNLSASLGDYTSVITRFNNKDKKISDLYEGKMMGEIWGYSVEGLFATDEEAAAYQAKINDKAVNGRVYSSKLENKLMAGDVKFKDLDDSGSINTGSGTVDKPGDRRVIGNKTPRYNYSFRLGASWNGIDVSAFFQGVGKQDWMPSELAYDFWGPYSFPSLSFIHKDFLNNTWSSENLDAYFPRPRGYSSYDGGSLGVASDRYLQDVSFLRLKNVTIGYTLPFFKQIFQQIKVYVTGENLYYWSALKKYSKTVDPELTNTSSTYNSGSGVGYGYSKSFSVGINITF